ncbi:MAG: hydroxymethylglutaryl-CoA synthase [Aeriscardovia sp.]|nr:hydroxymethylglutaryl-CoA synthase [Aeriscardovia sp.]MBQ1357263.1 hydroxymethylglutaryl-CoA synthase [Aeriscardovia sp.]MBQ1424838.1 hydroxymethylglutaryl-CoA synthase [Aeriscardovia sp.]MBQ5556847.1 hydroxymethylglutaryl-CoA synthase [Aeriscardovia sp.]
MSEAGIDRIGFATTSLFLDMRDLAESRGVDPEKYTVGIGQLEQSVAPSSQDCVTLAAAAAKDALEGEDLEKIDMVLLGTESGVDASRAAAVYVKQLLGLPDRVRCLEIKQACFGATGALAWAMDYVSRRPGRKVLAIGSDVARYGLNTPGEVTQGAGAVALLCSSDPKILKIEDDSRFLTVLASDFWRPTYSNCAIARGHYSTEVYLECFSRLWKQYKDETGRSASDFDAFLFHLPFSKMGLKALREVLKEADPERAKIFQDRFEASSAYGRRVGNIYSGSLYLSLLSLLESSLLEEGSRIALFSYGSGAEAEIFSATLREGYFSMLSPSRHLAAINGRRKVEVAEYEHLFSDFPPANPQDYSCDERYFAGPFRLTGIRECQRQYEAEG